LRAKRNFAPRVPALLDVSNIFADEVADHGGVDPANEIRGKNKAAIHGYRHVDAPAAVRPGNFPAQSRDPSGNARGGIARALAPAHRIGSSAITVLACVLSCAATPMQRLVNPRARGKQADCGLIPPLSV